MARVSNRQAPSCLQAENIRPPNEVGLRWWTRMKGGMRIKDWRSVAHSAKVGLALALVSLSVLLQDVFDKLGQNAIWAILTVVVVFEYSVGATLSKGLNRGLGTILAASLGLIVDYMANFTGAAEPFVVGSSVFLIGMTATYTRFVPSIKAKYDYAVVIFLLTFCLVVISGYRVPDNIEVVYDRIKTVLLGVGICFLVSIFIFPIWAGDDLHDLVIQNFEGLANSLEECLKEYFQGVQKLSGGSSKISKGQPFDDDKIYKGYRGVLISKQTEESLASFASWEPQRGCFGCMYPWKSLVEVGAILRHCAYTVSALHGCVLSEIQAPESLRKVFATSCIKIGEEVSEVLRGVACDLKAKKKTNTKQILLYKVRLTIDDLNYLVHTYPCFIYESCLQNPNQNHNNSIPIPNPKSNTNYTPCLQQGIVTTQSPSICHEFQTPSYVSPSPKFSPSVNQPLDLTHFHNPSLNHLYNSHVISHPNSHVISIPNSTTSSINLSAPPNPNPNPKTMSNYDPCGIDIEIPNLDRISTSHLNCILNSHPNSNVLGDKESTTPNSLPQTPIEISKENIKASFMIHESIEFAESLSLASLIALLIEIVARVEHLLDAIADFQDKDGFRKASQHDEKNPCVDMKVEVNDTSNHILNHYLSASHAE